MSAGFGNRGADRTRPLLLGVLLVAAGVVWLLGSILNVDVGHYGWPLFVIVPGIVLLVAGLSTPHEAGIGMVTGGSAATASGLIIAVQNATGWWASWAYAWALIAPFGIGLGLILAGWRWNRPGLARNGARAALAGLGLFAAGFIFFEGLIGLDGIQLIRLNGSAWAALLIAVGVIWLVVNLVRRGPKGDGISQN
jgi:hypothetical protein